MLKYFSGYICLSNCPVFLNSVNYIYAFHSSILIKKMCPLVGFKLCFPPSDLACFRLLSDRELLQLKKVQLPLLRNAHLVQIFSKGPYVLTYSIQFTLITALTFIPPLLSDM